mmetsp:Transcript_10670/g.13343  ORF Transcript_10670/g.13343 Transcript_10670/m.13343 type:complete len:147 (+) Transcript_10670:127-567(+)
MDPLKALDIFGWLVNNRADFCRIRSNIYRLGDPLDAIFATLSPLSVLSEANRLLQLLDDASFQREQAERDLLLTQVKQSTASSTITKTNTALPLTNRIAMAKSVVQGERRALLALIHAVQEHIRIYGDDVSSSSSPPTVRANFYEL